uniref:Dynactin subunit 6 n=1 Tax=Globodera pallida TaxID=36090 RepID=A0A183BVK6_GLOPA
MSSADLSSLAISSPNRTRLEIHPEATVVANCMLRGHIIIGPGTVIHPHAVIDSGEGCIEFGTNNIVEETAKIQNLNQSDTMRIGNDNLFEVGSVCLAKEVGDYNVFGIQSQVGADVQVTSGCQIGPRCAITTREVLQPMTGIHFQNNQRRIMCEKVSLVKRTS